MKKGILIILIFVIPTIHINAQWNGTDPLWTNSKVGVGNSNPESKLSVEGFVNNGLYHYGIGFKGSGSSPANGHHWYGVKSEVELSSYADDRLYGVYSLVSKTNNSGGAGFMYSFYANHKVNSGKKVTYGFGYYARPEVDGTIENYYGLKLDANIGNGAINNKWGIYQSSSDYKNYFAGKVGIGTNSPIEKLTIGDMGGYIAVRDRRTATTGTYASGFKFYDYGGESAAILLEHNGYQGVSARSLKFSVNLDERMRIDYNGNVGIGTTTPSNKLEVNGTIRSKEVKVEASPWPDYVFSKEYHLRPLQEVDTYIQQHGSLPEIPTAKEVEENGINLGEMNAKLLQKIEELTLYVIELNKEIETLKRQNENQNK